jgi:hypothetical protein
MRLAGAYEILPCNERRHCCPLVDGGQGLLQVLMQLWLLLQLLNIVANPQQFNSSFWIPMSRRRAPAAAETDEMQLQYKSSACIW